MQIYHARINRSLNLASALVLKRRHKILSQTHIEMHEKVLCPGAVFTMTFLSVVF
jgi:hypothetical protein